MALLPFAVVRAQLDEEISAARAWAQRRGLTLNYEEEQIPLLRIAMQGPGGERYLLGGEFEDYPTLPPSWRFLDPRDGEQIGPAAFPAPAKPYTRGSPLVLDGGSEGVVLCAHFNRLAYSEEGGPHGDWGGLANWRNPGTTGYAFAERVAEMLARIELDVADSVGRKAPLP